MDCPSQSPDLITIDSLKGKREVHARKPMNILQLKELCMEKQSKDLSDWWEVVPVVAGSIFFGGGTIHAQPHPVVWVTRSPLGRSVGYESCTYPIYDAGSHRWGTIMSIDHFVE